VGMEVLDSQSQAAAEEDNPNNLEDWCNISVRNDRAERKCHTDKVVEMDTVAAVVDRSCCCSYFAPDNRTSCWHPLHEKLLRCPARREEVRCRTIPLIQIEISKELCDEGSEKNI
jgi:hypothetical protein